MKWFISLFAGVAGLVSYSASAEVVITLQSTTKDVSRAALIRQAEKSQGPVLKILRREKIPFRAFYIANVVVADHLSARAQAQIDHLPNVVGLRVVKPMKLQLPPAVPGISRYVQDIPEQIRALQVDRVWSDLGVKGEGVVVGSIDTGVMWTHEAIQSRYRGLQNGKVDHNYNWHDAVHSAIMPTEKSAENCSFNSAEPCDDNSHGTHTVGTMVGEQVGRDRFGVAPDAKWIACRGLDHGWGAVSTYLECLEFFLAPYPLGKNARRDGRPDLAPNVINISWICEAKEGCLNGHELFDAVHALKNAGIMVVVAAGNDGPACRTIEQAPASYTSEVLTVGAVDHRDGQIADFSSRGPSAFDGEVSPRVVAPGVFLRSAVPGGSTGDYQFKSGTSMAAPHVAGVVALMWSANPAWKGRVDETIQRLTETAVPKTSGQSCGAFEGNKIPNAVYGYGMVDAYRAVSSLPQTSP